MDYASCIKKTNQRNKIPGKDQIKNNEGGYVFKTKDVLNRFLVLGTEGGSFYASESKLTIDNVDKMIHLVKTDGINVVNRTIEVSLSGIAHKNDPAIFVIALACAYGDLPTKTAARHAIHKVCRIGTHLFTFMGYYKKLLKSNRGVRNGISLFYSMKTVEELTYQIIKYRNRNGWTHKDVLAVAHPEVNGVKNEILRYAANNKNRPYDMSKLPDQIKAFESIQGATKSRALDMIRLHKLPLECVPTKLQKDPDMWNALIPNMPMMAMVRNLGRMSACGLLTNFNSNIVTDKITPEAIKKSRIHPLYILYALRTYSAGCGVRGDLIWNVAQNIVDALDDAFYMSFENVVPTGKNFLLGLDVSGSMRTKYGILSCCEISSAMAMTTVRTENNYEIMGFSKQFKDLGISKRDRLDTVMKKAYDQNFGSTDCSLPMMYAMKHNLPIDAFVVYTDSETYAGSGHPSQELEKYRQKSGRDAKLIVCGIASSGFTIADPDDYNSLDIVGFSAGVPAIISNFVK